MKMSDRALAWTVFAAVVLVVGGAVGPWLLNVTVIAPSCGDVADAQLIRATQEMQGRIPSMRVVDLGGGCDSGYQVSADWETDDADQFRNEAIATGCWANEPDPEDLADGDLSESFTCKTTGRDVVLIFDLGSSPVEGELFLS